MWNKDEVSYVDGRPTLGKYLLFSRMIKLQYFRIYTVNCKTVKEKPEVILCAIPRMDLNIFFCKKYL